MSTGVRTKALLDAMLGDSDDVVKPDEEFPQPLLHEKVEITEKFHSRLAFLRALDSAFQYAKNIWVPWDPSITASLPELKGEVKANQSFEICIDDDELILLTGLRVTLNPYGVPHPISYQMTIGGTTARPFVIHPNMRCLYFLGMFMIRPEEQFRICQVDTSASPLSFPPTLWFSLLGASIRKRKWLGLSHENLKALIRGEAK